MKVLINPKIEEQGSGLSSTISFENMDFVDAMNRCFNIRSREQIEQLEIFDDGWITARIVNIQKAEGE